MKKVRSVVVASMALFTLMGGAGLLTGCGAKQESGVVVQSTYDAAADKAQHNNQKKYMDEMRAKGGRQ